MQDNNRNFLLAIILSVIVLIGWQVFVAVPRMQQEQAKREQTTKAPGQQGQPAAPAAPGAPQTGASAPAPPETPAMQTRAEIIAGSSRVQIETPVLKGSIALKGGRLDDLVLKKYRETVKPTSDPVVLLSPSGTPDAYYAEHGYVPSAGTMLALPGPDTEWKAQGNATLTPDAPVTLAYDNGQGLLFRRTFAVDDNYMFSIRQEVENRSDQPVTLHPYGLISRHGLPHAQGEYILHEGLIGVLGAEGLHEIDYKDMIEDGTKSFTGITGGWLGITDKYWAAVVIPPQGVSYQGRFGATAGENPRFQSDYLLAPLTIAPGATEKIESNLFAGAKEVDVIDGDSTKYVIPKLDLLIDWGWFYFLTKPLFYALDYFYKLVGNFGIAILIVTVVIKLILFPLANKSYVAMSKMKKLQPEMVRIKERFGDDKVRQQQALMELYKTEKVNPASGCLPILVQIPVFFALYKVLNISIEMRHAPFYGWIQDLSAPDPTTLFNLFGLIPWTPPHFLMVGIWPLIMGVTMFVQMRLNPAPPDPIQQKIFAWMPLFFTFILAPFPAGLVIYWAWNNTLSVLQQMVIMNRQGVEITLFQNLGIKKPRPSGSSKT